MAGQDFEAENNLTMPIVPTVLEETWENATLYYSIPNPDPTLNDCKPTILQSEIEVSIWACIFGVTSLIVTSLRVKSY